MSINAYIFSSPLTLSFFVSSTEVWPVLFTAIICYALTSILHLIIAPTNERI